MMNSKIKKRERRSKRAKEVIKRSGKLRMVVSRSNKNIYCQIIDDKQNKTLVSTSSLSKELDISNGGNKDAAVQVGALLAEKVKKLGLENIAFDRNGNLYHGRVKALAESARANGLNF